MRKYEIRILKSYNQPSLVFVSSQPSDLVAVQVAHRLSEDRGFEVWREMDCICRQLPNLSASPNNRTAASHSAHTESWGLA
jgi:hypothetical protein